MGKEVCVQLVNSGGTALVSTEYRIPISTNASTKKANAYTTLGFLKALGGKEIAPVAVALLDDTEIIGTRSLTKESVLKSIEQVNQIKTTIDNLIASMLHENPPADLAQEINEFDRKTKGYGLISLIGELNKLNTGINLKENAGVHEILNAVQNLRLSGAIGQAEARTHAVRAGQSSASGT